MRFDSALVQIDPKAHSTSYLYWFRIPRHVRGRNTKTRLKIQANVTNILGISLECHIFNYKSYYIVRGVGRAVGVADCLVLAVVR